MTALWHSGYDEGVPQTLEPYPDRTLLDFLRESASSWPDRPALLFKGATVTYGKLHRLSDNFAASLSALGVRKGDRVALCLPNSPQFIVAEVGAWKIGAIVCPINPTYTDRELRDALDATGAETIVVLNRLYERLKNVQPGTALTRVIASGIKDFLPFAKRVGYSGASYLTRNEIKLDQNQLPLQDPIAYRGNDVDVEEVTVVTNEVRVPVEVPCETEGGCCSDCNAKPRTRVDLAMIVVAVAFVLRRRRRR